MATISWPSSVPLALVRGDGPGHAAIGVEHRDIGHRGVEGAAAGAIGLRRDRQAVGARGGHRLANQSAVGRSLRPRDCAAAIGIYNRSPWRR